VQTVIETSNKQESDGVAAARVDKCGPRFCQTGRFARADDRPTTPDTQFEIGSVTKVFTALLLAVSERTSRVRCDDPVTKYLQVRTSPEGRRRPVWRVAWNAICRL
jgi:D-alanyl-D-alanine-carboxypeptidase/D-alanyl-D-alanine-endopeptidase